MKPLRFLRIPLLLVFLLSAITIVAQPSNDECSGAWQITQDEFPHYYSANSLYATQSMPGYGGGQANDVWFTFTATSNILFIRLDNYPMRYQLFSGSCGSLAGMSSDAPDGYCADLPDSIYVTPGQTYYIRAYFTGITFYQDFHICLLSKPFYDVCHTAPELGMNYDNVIESDSLTFGSMMYGRVSHVPPIPYMQMTTGGIDDIWFKFVATDTAHSVWVGSISYILCWPTFPPYPYIYAKYRGCNAVDTFFEDDGGQIGYLDSPLVVDYHSLTIGDTYYLRLWTNKNQGTSADFFAGVGPLGVTGQMPPPPPLSLSSTANVKNEMIVVPNPATSNLYIEMKGGHIDGRLKVYDVSGKVIYQNSAFRGKQNLDIEGFSQGMYFVRYVDDVSSITTKFVKQ